MNERQRRRRIASQLIARRDSIIAAWWNSQFDPDRLNRYHVEGQSTIRRASISQHFLGPLFDLFTGYLRTGNQNYSDLYLDERLRYAPHRADPSERAKFFSEVLEVDEVAILSAISDPNDSDMLRRSLEELHAPLREAQTIPPIRILAVGDCLMNEVRVALGGAARRVGTPIDFRMLYLSAPQGRDTPAGQVLEFLDSFPADLLALSFLSYEGLPLYPALLRDGDRRGRDNVLDSIEGMSCLVASFLEQLRAHTDAPILLHNASGLPLTRYRRRIPWISALSYNRRATLSTLNETLRALAENTPNTILIDEFELAATTGWRHCSRPIVPTRTMRDAFFHTSAFGSVLAPTYLDILNSFQDLRRIKVLLIDFDNTLWRGVMAEGQVDHHHSFQRLLRKLKDAGILLVAVSKNDPASIRWDELSLTADDFVLLKIGWNQKVQSINEAAQELDLGLDTFAIIDDSPEERELVRIHLPMVRTLDPNDETSHRWLERMLQFPNTRQTGEAAARTQLYRQQAQRRKIMTAGVDYPEMMRALELDVRFCPAARADIPRIAELVQRTNQFNTTTIRYSKQELTELLTSSTHALYVATLSDKLGSMGLVVVVVVERRGPERIIQSFVMSCRAMGFGVEQAVLRETLALELANGANRFIGKFVQTDRNTPARDLFSRNGFILCDHGHWQLNVPFENSPHPDWLRVSRLHE